jgi:hypothetical protein
VKDVVPMGEVRNEYKPSVGKVEHLADLAIDGKIILSCNFNELSWKFYTGLRCLRRETSGVSF